METRHGPLQAVVQAARSQESGEWAGGEDYGERSPHVTEAAVQELVPQAPEQGLM